jgi:hypothetical protein
MPLVNFQQQHRLLYIYIYIYIYTEIHFEILCFSFLKFCKVYTCASSYLSIKTVNSFLTDVGSIFIWHKIALLMQCVAAVTDKFSPRIPIY